MIKKIAVVVFIISSSLLAYILLFKNDNKISTQVVQTQAVSQPISKNINIHSPDGKMHLILNSVSDEFSVTYNLSVLDTEENEFTNIFSTSLPTGDTIEISQNSWSPDNKYFFIREITNGVVSYKVYKDSGQVFSEGINYIEVASQFVAKETGYTLKDVTGWASPTLLMLITQKESQNGPNYWFEVPRGAIIRLAS